MIEWGEDNERRSGHDGVPGGAVELEGEDDVISAADLTDEATLGAQVAVEHVVGGVLAQCHQVGCVFALRYLENKQTRIKDVSRCEDDWCSYIIHTAGYLSKIQDTVQMARLQQVRSLFHPDRELKETNKETSLKKKVITLHTHAHTHLAWSFLQAPLRQVSR